MPTTPYSPADLAEFKANVEAKLAEARTDLGLLDQVIAGDLKQPVAELPIADGITLDDVCQLAIRQRKFIAHLETALTRIANKTYGICRVTGKTISKERLMQVPHATLCLPARESVLKKETDTTAAQ